MSREATGLKRPETAGVDRGAVLWAKTWPKLAAIAIVLVIWQAIYLSGWKPAYLFASPLDTLDYLSTALSTPRFWTSVATTLSRAVLGFLLALAIGSAVGIAFSQWKMLRSGFGALLTGLLTMPSIVWFPFAIMMFGLTQESIFFVIVIGAAPSIANGIISGIDDIPPQFLKAGHMLGARGIDRYRYVIVPAILPSYVSGLAQGWAFAWRGLMAGELLVVIPGLPALGSDLRNAGDMGTAAQLFGLMVVILVIGMLASLVFSSLAHRVRAARGLTGFDAA